MSFICSIWIHSKNVHQEKLASNLTLRRHHWITSHSTGSTHTRSGHSIGGILWHWVWIITTYKRRCDRAVKCTHFWSHCTARAAYNRALCSLSFILLAPDLTRSNPVIIARVGRNRLRQVIIVFVIYCNQFSINLTNAISTTNTAPGNESDLLTRSVFFIIINFAPFLVQILPKKPF